MTYYVLLAVIFTQYPFSHGALQCQGQDEQPTDILQTMQNFQSYPESMLETVCPGSSKKYFRLLGCYQDIPKRLLSEKHVDLVPNTPERCVQMCYQSGFMYAGVEYGIQCFCGNLPPSIDAKINDSNCDKKCTGNATITCGGGWTIDVFETGIESNCLSNEVFKHFGCFKDSLLPRLLPHEFGIVRVSNSPGRCTKLCLLNGFMYAGTEYGNHCFCGNQKPTEELKTTQQSCSTKCSGNSFTNCGGTLFIDVYETGIKLIHAAREELQSHSIDVRLQVKDVSEKIQSAHLYPESVLSSFCPGTGRKYLRHLGCYQDSAIRILNEKHIIWSHNTPERCAQLCLHWGASYAGVESTSICFCGNKSPSSVKLDEGKCNMKCNGNQDLKCGGLWAIDVYETGFEKDCQRDQVQNYLGCYVDAIQRTLPYEFDVVRAANTPEKCIEICLLNGFSYAGTELSNWCFCGNQKPTLELKIPEDKCNMKCNGDKSVTCGGLWAMQVYETGIRSFFLSGNNCPQ